MKKLIVRKYDSIIAQADTRRETIRQLKLTLNPLFHHLTKLVMFPNAQEVNHWRKEVSDLLNTVDKMKQNKKFPSKQFILDNTWEIKNDTLNERMEALLKEYDYSTDATHDDIYNKLEAYFDWLSEELSTKGIVARPDIINKLKGLGM